MPGQVKLVGLGCAALGLIALGCFELDADPERTPKAVRGVAGESSDSPVTAGAPPGGVAGSIARDPEPVAPRAGAGGAGGLAGINAGEAGTPGDPLETAGAGGEEGAGPSSICVGKSGAAIPYDHSRGLAGEYAFELAMSCELGGYVTPLVEQDPVMLTGVDAYAAALTDWLRADIMVCAEAPVSDESAVFLLLPSGGADEVSRGDFQAAVQLFLRVLDRHDELEDGLDSQTKQELRRRLEALAPLAVKAPGPGLSRPSEDPACMPAPGAGGAAGAASS